MYYLKEILTTSSYGWATMKRFVRRVIITFLVLITLSFIAAYFLFFQPTQNQLTAGLIENYEQQALTRYQFFNNRVNLSLQSAENLASRGMIMNAMLDYKDGKMNLEELTELSQPQYLINTHGIDYLIRAERFIDGNIISSMIVEEYTYDCPAPDEIYKVDKIIDTFRLENGNIYYEVISPISSDGRVIGHDRLIFCFNEQIAILDSQDVTSTIISSKALAELANNAELIQTSEVGETINKEQVFYHIASLTDNYYFVTSQNEADLLHNLNKIKSRAPILGAIIFILLAVAICPLIILYARKEFSGYENIHRKLSKELSQAKIDPLTNVGVRRACEEHLKLLFNYYEKTGISPAIIMFDIDDLKDINDSYGHIAGDLAITEVVAAVAENIRTKDYLYRWGGDEFIAIIDGLEQQHAYQFVEKILQAVADAKIEYKGESINSTISIGLTYFNERDFVYLDAIDRVDQAMYKSKLTGKKGATII